jgi:mannosyltransferase
MSSAPAGQHNLGLSGAGPESPPRPQPPPAAGAVAARSRARAVTARYAPAALAAATMACYGLRGLARGSMSNDEVATHWAALLSLRQLGHLLSHVDAVHGTYYLLIHGWMALGTSPTITRVPSVISMIAAVAMTVIIGRRLTGSGWAGLFSGLIMALTPIVSYYAQTARSYALVFACVIGSTLALVRAMDAETGQAAGALIARRWLVYAALVTLGGYLNELSLLVLTAHAITVLLSACGRRAAAHWTAAAAGGALLVTPLVVLSSREDGAVAWIARPGPRALHVLLHDYFSPVSVVAVLLVACAIAAVLPSAATLRRWLGGAAGVAPPRPAWPSRGGVSLPSVAVPLLVMPASVLILESLVARPFYVDRYVLYGEAGAALLAGAGMYRIGRWLGAAAGRRPGVWVPGLVVCLCALLLQLGPQHRIRTPQSRGFDYGGPSAYVGDSARAGDGVLFFNAFFRKAELGYPRDFRKTTDFALAVPPVRAGTFQGRDKPLAVTRPLLLGYRRIWVIGRVPSPQLRSVAFSAESRELESRFSLIAERHFRGMTVTLWLRR